MFTKPQRVGTITQGQIKPVYKTVIDWEAVGGFIFISFILLAILSQCGSG